MLRSVLGDLWVRGWTSDKTRGDALRLIDRHAIDPEPGFRNRSDVRFPADDFANLHLNRDALGRGDHLAAIFPGDLMSWGQRLKTRIFETFIQPRFEHEELQQLYHRLDSQRAGHHGVLK